MIGVLPGKANDRHFNSPGPLDGLFIDSQSSHERAFYGHLTGTVCVLQSTWKIQPLS